LHYVFLVHFQYGPVKQQRDEKIFGWVTGHIIRRQATSPSVIAQMVTHLDTDHAKRCLTSLETARATGNWYIQNAIADASIALLIQDYQKT
jgi:hypothetical protein